jgi:signal transduction histidine kinase
MSESQLRQLYKPYSQLGREKQNSHDGLGVGLYIVKNILRHISATIDISSNLDEGTIVTINFKKALLKTIKAAPTTLAP